MELHDAVPAKKFFTLIISNMLEDNQISDFYDLFRSCARREKVEHRTISSLPNKPKSHKVFFLCLIHESLDITIGKLASICWQITELQNPLLYVCNLSRAFGTYNYMHAIWRRRKKGTKDREKKILTRFSHQKQARRRQVSHIICAFSIDGIFADFFAIYYLVASMLFVRNMIFFLSAFLIMIHLFYCNHIAAKLQFLILKIFSFLRQN